MHQLEGIGEIELNVLAAEARFEHAQRAADHFLQRQPLFMQIKAAGLDPRHIQQVVYQPGGVEHMLADFVGLRGMLRALAGQIEGQDFRLAKQHGQRGTQIVGQGGEQRVTQAFALAGQPGLLFAGGQGEALQRAGHQQGEGLQQPLLLRDHQLAQILWLHHQ